MRLSTGSTSSSPFFFFLTTRLEAAGAIVEESSRALGGGLQIEEVQQITPRAIIENAWSSLCSCSSARRRRKAANLRQLQYADSEDLDVFHKTNDGLDLDVGTDEFRSREAIAADVQKAAHLLA
ncbi:hypothetical protein PF005_g3331 [Phytophthora fragariae]|uniref:Uncharacterized protein n=1 Tax=Phytophthora fragariae TaxID=53985 RepID=A0A6A3Z890_9STRA|nr:hypothetical protein PF005_g3331 [Phytophthora fragariae]KAE9253368.1 hypothetical protein PF004_g1541 [Phytophthora fragariae]